MRALAWLLDAPNLLDPEAPQWQGKIASLHEPTPATIIWLNTLDKQPQSLHAYLGDQPMNRLGRYAEKLMAFFFAFNGTLAAHGLQVQNGKNATIGEFDFLLKQGNSLLHWEFATKFYLLESDGADDLPDHFVGPNLADTLGAKMRKIMDQQLALSLHPAASAYLPQPVAAAQALVKGWLFYYGGTPWSAAAMPPPCRGFWLPAAEFRKLKADGFVILSRLRWLAPASATPDQCMSSETLENFLKDHFIRDDMPVMIALMHADDGRFEESDRGFIVPDGWRDRAGERISRMIAAV
ncbi:MAG TPA: DUF1853 family protein [Noviherbaspirillum sp.]|uniref:DUF1853 family protein n=1 Tax=Noviherbaspirillum sp. TaxID=1926288 RepID=UPI002DDCE6F2|nr:DUF1853 family protein [Noviherbaspirillum sp.]HEV2610964.1 DUF1853 family protein [Noviherbaspirillum sp.]